MRSSSAPVETEGRLRGVQGIAVDITALKEAEEGRKEAETNLESLFDAISESVFLMKRNGKILAAKTPMAARLGETPERIVGKNAFAFVPPDVAARRRIWIDEVCRTGKAVTIEDERDGRVMEHHIYPVVNGTGEVNRVAIYAADVTDRKRSEAERERLMTAIEHAGESIVITDSQGTIRYVNPAFERTTGFSRDEALGRNLRMFQSGAHDAPTYLSFWDALSEGRSWHGAFINTRKDGKKYTEEATLTPVRDSEGRIVNYVAVSRDVTERVELFKQLHQAQKMEAVGTLAGGVAHDFNNILQVALGYSELLLGEDELPAQCRADLQKIRDSARRGADLVQRLLTFSRKSEINPRPLNLNHRISELRKMLERTIPKMIDIELRLDERLAVVNADPTQVDQVIMNLAVNARDAMPEGGKLIVETTNVVLQNEYVGAQWEAKPGPYALLSVTDTGTGIDKDTLERIFEPFFTTKAAGEGTGLGLSIVHGIVRRHGGHVRCYSEPGQGTSFKIYLPALVSQEAVEESDAQSSASGGSETVLLVDDEDVIRDLGAKMLKRKGYKVITACNGMEALEMYRAGRDEIDLVLLDLIMPEMGGKQCLEGLIAFDPSVKVIIASGYSAQGPAREAIEAGAKGFVNKPYEMGRVLEVVRAVLDGPPES